MTDHQESKEITVLSVLQLDAQALNELSPRERVLALEAVIRKQPAGDLIHALPLRHFLANVIYVRELSIPKGVVGIGRIHKHDHVVIISGDISVYDEHGMQQRLTGPHNTFTSKAGIKRAAYAHADTLFATAHRIPDDVLAAIKDPACLDASDIAALEQAIATETYEEFDQYMLTTTTGLLP